MAKGETFEYVRHNYSCFDFLFCITRKYFFGRDKRGFNRKGIHKNGTRFDDFGYDITGYDKNGYNRNGYDKQGYNKLGLNIDGYKIDGRNANGKYNRLYDKQSYIKDIYNREGFLDPQIYPIAYCCLHGVTYHITEYPILVTRPPQKNKVWGYGSGGLIGDVFDNFVKLDITMWQKVKMEMKFLVEQYWRYAMYIKRGVGKFLGCIGSILKSPNTL